MSSDQPTSAARQLQTFAAKRKALEKLLLMAKSLATLSNSLEKLTSFSNAGGDITAPAQDFYDRLSVRLNQQPAAEIVRQMTELDEKLRDDMEHIVGLSSADENSIAHRIRALNPTLQGTLSELLDDYLKDFERRAKLAIALRMFLNRQSIPTPGIKFSFSENQLEQELQTVRRREQDARETVRERVAFLIEDTEKILNNSSYPENIRDEVLGVRNELLDCLSHLDAGHDIVSLPLIVDEVFISDTPVEERKPRSPEPVQELTLEAQEEVATEVTEKEAVHHERPTQSQPAEPAPKTLSATDLPDLRNPSAGHVLWTWLKTPKNVTWDEAKKIASWELNRKNIQR